MSLPPLLKHVYNYGTNEVIMRGKKIFHTQGVSLLDLDYHIEQIRFRVRNDLYNSFYTVTVSRFLQPEHLSVRCQCPYNLGEICRHEVAALFQLNDMIQGGFFESSNVTYNQKHTVVRMRNISAHMIQLFSSEEILETATKNADKGLANITYNKNERVEADIPEEDQTFHVAIAQNEDRYFDTSCGCGETKYPLCVHKATLFLQLLRKFGPQYFKSLQNWDDQKNKLLRQYGYSLNDDLTGKFEFIYEDGKPFLRVLDPSIKKVAAAAPVAAPAPQPASIIVEETEPKHIGVVLDLQNKSYPFVSVELITGDTDEGGSKFIGPIEKLDLNKYINADIFLEAERDMIITARKLMPEEIVKYLKKNLPFGDFLGDYNDILTEHLQEELHTPVWEYLLPKYRQLLDKRSSNALSYIRPQGKSFSSGHLQQISFSETPAIPRLSITKSASQVKIKLEWEIDGAMVTRQDLKILNAALYLYDGRIYSIPTVHQVEIVEKLLPSGSVTLDNSEWPDYLEKNILRWYKYVDISFGKNMATVHSPEQPTYRLYIHERPNVLVLQPAFVYDHLEARMSDAHQLVTAQNGHVNIIERNEDAERTFTQMIAELHANMLFSHREYHYYIPVKDVLSKNWFFHFIDKMKEWNVELFGYEQLKQLRVNTNRPETKIQVSSGIDWFDTTVEIAYGDQLVSIADVKKALANKENFIRLGDGSIGLLPDDLVKKFSLLSKMGEIKGKKLRLKKIHFSVLDELLADVDEEALQQELEEKKKHLTRIIENDYTRITAPPDLKATLRPYQQAGLQWLIFLKEAGWGGILADDMGLGKTVQTLAFLAHYKNEQPTARFMVVCPTTLMYNWENEIRKFTPGFRALLHHGPKRTTSLQTFRDYDIIITSYGTLRSDIHMLKEFTFDYVVLDESQAIKNPKSMATKAAMLIDARNKLALSGTPLQNNTFDLYAQMNFLNPGMLGGREFFMNEFAVPIDKFAEDEAKQQLRKLIYPFMLRRTKSQVAKDLPEKTETVLYCEMDKEQRKIYDAYRNNYKAQILGMIDEQGIDRSKFHILQGLTKLRQICDSPALLNEEEKFDAHSIKLEELTREIEENVGDHKALVFSQFLGMLSLIRKTLDEKGIPYAYFDGSTSSADREKAIKNFQENDECRIFLISLKAGGIGLNLTAADYVYIVDPWWNPAVEQQAIDRTHRIGQTKNIFAYRFICKDTIEEKMMILQERKRALADELVTDESSILKRLTRDDIVFLFS